MKQILNLVVGGVFVFGPDYIFQVFAVFHYLGLN